MSSDPKPERQRSGRARFYHDVQLRGPIPDRLVFTPSQSLSEASAVSEGLLQLVADRKIPDPHADAYHQFLRFDWLPLLAVDDEIHALACRHLLRTWRDQAGDYTPQDWRVSLTSTRMFRMLNFIDYLVADIDGPERQDIFDLLARQARHLGRSLRRQKSDNMPSHLMAQILCALCLPEDRLVGAPETVRLGKALAPIAGGVIPASWRDPQKAIEAGAEMHSLLEAFTARRLSPPYELKEALKVVRLYLGGFFSVSGTMVQLPQQHIPDLRTLKHIGSTIHPEAERLFNQVGYATLLQGQNILAVDSGHRGQLSGVGGISLVAKNTPVIINCGAIHPLLSGHDDHLRDWADALSAPGSSSGWDISPTGKATLLKRDDPHKLDLYYPTTKGEVYRSFQLSHEGNSLSCSEQLPDDDLCLRLHLPNSTQVTLQDGAAKIYLANHLTAVLEVEDADLSAEESVDCWQGYNITKSRQLVISPHQLDIRWHLKWQHTI